MRKVPTLLAVAASAVVVAACGSSSHKSSTATASSPAATTASTAPASGPRIGTRTIGSLGQVLVNAQGRTLYLFVPDDDKKVSCVGACASVWPPAFLAAGQKPVASGLVKQSLLGSDPDPAGGRVITYAGWPLYTYVADTAPGTASGQAIELNGGMWYSLSPSGKAIKNKP